MIDEELLSQVQNFAPNIDIAPMSAPPQARQGLGGFLQNIGNFARNTIAPTNPNLGVDPNYAKAQQRLALLRLASGIAGGQNFASGLSQGLGAATNEYQAAMQNAYHNSLQKKQAEEQQAFRQHQLEQDKLAQQRFEATQQAEKDWREQQLKQRELERKALEDYRQRELQLRKLQIDAAGARTDQQTRQQNAKLRKEFRQLQTVKDYETILPLVNSAKTAPDTPQGDLQMIYTLAKVFDPGSVVREGELQLTKDAAPWLIKMTGEFRKQIQDKGALTPQMRKQMIDAMEQRASGYKQAYDRDYAQYGKYATDLGISPDEVVGTRPESAYSQGGPKQIALQSEYDALPSGSEYIDPNGNRRRKR